MTATFTTPVLHDGRIMVNIGPNPSNVVVGWNVHVFADIQDLYDYVEAAKARKPLPRNVYHAPRRLLNAPVAAGGTFNMYYISAPVSSYPGYSDELVKRMPQAIRDLDMQRKFIFMPLETPMDHPLYGNVAVWGTWYFGEKPRKDILIRVGH